MNGATRSVSARFFSRPSSPMVTLALLSTRVLALGAAQ
jgi:hypothetical protein